MDVNAILDESLKAFSRPIASKAAQFILMLSVIDRTILPRQVIFSNGRGQLRLAVAERKARRLDDAGLPAADSPSDLVQRMTRFCLEADALKHEIRPAKPASSPPGHGIAELVNAQQPASVTPAGPVGEPHSDGFRFDERGWPLAIPDASSAKSLVSAWLVYLWMQSWLKRHDEMLGDSMLLVTTEGQRSRELAFRFSPKATQIMSLGSAELGRLMAAWRVEGTPRQTQQPDGGKTMGMSGA
jgi:hypothetical protein